MLYIEKIDMRFHQVQPLFLKYLLFPIIIVTCEEGPGFGNLTITKILLISLTSCLGGLLMVLVS